ncbi:MAG: NAD(+) diphosphatase [Pseudomonadota bacterium]
MLRTPSSFTPLIVAHTHDDPLNFVFQGSQLLLSEDGATLPTLAQLDGLRGEMHPVGLLGERYCQASWSERDTPAPPGFAWRGLRGLWGELDDGLMGVAGRAVQIAEWARTHRYCGACAEPMALLAGERCFTCQACGMMAYPRISPAMMVLIRKGEQVLLAMHVASPSKRFTPLAGFLEAGESIEEAVHREVYEEVGLRVHNLKYFSSQSWPFPHSLMIGFTADYLDGEIRVDESEISEARWFGPGDEWPEKVPHISISSILVDAYRPK